MYKVIIINRICKIIFFVLCLIAIIIGTSFISQHNILTSIVYKDDTKLIIDAGHGGIDGGASSNSGLLEKDINLQISQKLDILSNFFGVHTLMTRKYDNSLEYDPSASIRTNKNNDLNKRLEIANSYENAIFISIHLNKFEQNQYYGAQVFYSPNDENNNTIAQILQKNLILGLDPKNTRKAKEASDSIYLMKHITIPAFIIECGFLSNEDESKLLETNEYQKQIAISILSALSEFMW